MKGVGCHCQFSVESGCLLSVEKKSGKWRVERGKLGHVRFSVVCYQLSVEKSGEWKVARVERGNCKVESWGRDKQFSVVSYKDI